MSDLQNRKCLSCLLVKKIARLRVHELSSHLSVLKFLYVEEKLGADRHVEVLTQPTHNLKIYHETDDVGNIRLNGFSDPCPH